MDAAAWNNRVRQGNGSLPNAQQQECLWHRNRNRYTESHWDAYELRLGPIKPSIGAFGAMLRFRVVARMAIVAKAIDMAYA